MSSSGIAVSITAGLYQRYQRKAILPVPMGLAELLVPWLLSGDLDLLFPPALK